MNLGPKRVFKWIGKGLAYLLGFVALVVTLVLVALQTPWAQHKIVRVISEQADASLHGRVEVALDGSLGLFGFSALSVRILPADVNDNRPLAELSKVRAGWDLEALVTSLVGSGPLYIGINHVEAERAFVDLRTDADGRLALANATSVVPSNEPEAVSSGPRPLIHLQGLDVFNVRILLPADDTAPSLSPSLQHSGAEAGAPAATIERIHADFDMQDVMSGTVMVTSLEATIPGQASRFIGDVGAAFYLDEQSVPVAKATIDGDLEGLPVKVEGVYDDTRWSARVEADGEVAAWQGAVAGFDPTDAISVSALALGDLEAADVSAQVRAGTGRLAADAHLAFAPLTASGVVVVERANPNSFATVAPVGTVTLSVGFSAQTEPQLASAWLELRDSSIEDKPIPDFDLAAWSAGATHAEFRLKATDGSGLELNGKVDNAPEALTFSLQGATQRLPEYRGAPQLSAFDVQNLDLDANGTWRAQTQSLDASLQLDVDRLTIPSAKVWIADLSTKVSTKGKLTAPSLNGTVAASASRVGELRATNVRVQAQDLGGGQSAVSASARVRLNSEAPVRDLVARTTLTAFSPITARSTRVEIKAEKQALVTDIGTVRVGDGMVIDDVRLSGIGNGRGQLALTNDSVDASVEVEALDLAGLSQLFQPLVPPLTGAVNANVALASVGQRLKSAHVFASATSVGSQDIHADSFGASLVVKRDALSGVLTLQRGHSHVRVDARDVDLAALRRSVMHGFRAADFRGYLVATILAHSRDFSELEQAQGEIHVEGQLQSQVLVEQRDDLPLKMSSAVRLLEVDLRKAEPRVPVDWLSGTDVALDQDSRDEPTRTREGDELVKEGSQWAITGLNADWLSVYDGSTGQWVNTIAASDRDRPAKLASVSLTTKVPLAQLNDQLGEWIPNAPLDGSLVVPAVALDALPGGSFVPTGIDASIQADIQLSGTVASPQAEGSLYVRDFQVSANNASFPVTLVVDAKASKEAVTANFRVTHDALQLVTGNVDGTLQHNEWHALAKIDDLPLGQMPYVRDYGVVGSLSGDLALDTGAPSPKVALELRAENVEAYGERIRNTLITAQVADGRAQFAAELEQTSGHAQLSASATSASGQLADYRLEKATLKARSFQIRPALVALQGTVSDLSGLLDGAVEVAFRDGAANATGEVKLRDGLVLMPALGKQVHDIELTVRAVPGQLELSRLSAKVERGLVRGDGKLRYTTDGRMLAEVELRLPDNKRLPIANKGRDIAEASGRIKLGASSGPSEQTKLSVDVPELDVYFSDSATDKVMSSESPAFVSLGTYLPDGHFVTYSSAKETAKKDTTATEDKATSSAKPMLVTVNLGRKVWLHHGTSTFAGINGKIAAMIGGETRLTGMLNLAEGRIDIQGRVFDIRPGTVTFRGDSPPNPDVVAEAAWNAPSGYTVIAAYRGSVTNGKVVLRSEPALSYGEILNVLLFDDPEGAGGSDGSPGAGEVAATIASAGLSQSLTSLTDMDIQANIETDAAGSPRPELGVRLTPRLAVEVAYNLEPSAALSQPPDKAFVSFDWRLSNSWTVEATLGDHGSAATDLTWKYRY